MQFSRHEILSVLVLLWIITIWLSWLQVIQTFCLLMTISGLKSLWVILWALTSAGSIWCLCWRLGFWVWKENEVMPPIPLSGVPAMRLTPIFTRHSNISVLLEFLLSQSFFPPFSYIFLKESLNITESELYLVPHGDGILILVRLSILTVYSNHFYYISMNMNVDPSSMWFESSLCAY